MRLPAYEEIGGLAVIAQISFSVVPETVRIITTEGAALSNSSILGPYDEGTHVTLNCEAHGGRPTPKVSWYNGTHEIKGKTKLDFPDIPWRVPQGS